MKPNVLALAAALSMGISGVAYANRAAIMTVVSAFSAIDPVSQRNGTAIVEPNQVNQPWGRNEGVFQFRGNPMRNFYGTGINGGQTLPRTRPRLLWQYPERGVLSSESKIIASGTHTWTGTGWTGQPVVWRRPDNGVLEMIVGAFDKKVHFLNAETGRPTRQPFVAGDLVKGSVTLDPDGYPLLYFGAVGDGREDGYYRALALDREPVQELWKVHANSFNGYKYSRDWDGNSSVINDHLIIGAEIGWILGWKLNRRYDAQNLVQVSPTNFIQMNADNRQYNELSENRNTGFEASCASFRTILYCANGQGRIIGVDLNHVVNLQPKIVFDFWTGDDVDATPTVDENGMLYVAVEHERINDRNPVVGQLIKLDPSQVEIDPRTGRPDPLSLKPIVWKVNRPGALTTSANENYAREGEKGGFWATPALDAARNALYVPSHRGELLSVDRNTGEVLWSDRTVGYHAWSSPNIIGDTLVVGRCTPRGGLIGYDITNPRQPRKIWEVFVPDGGCVESSVAIHNGKMYVGTRGGHVYAFGW